jgi:hypothetical protein
MGAADGASRRTIIAYNFTISHLRLSRAAGVLRRVRGAPSAALAVV